jgi:hypothetical protein
MAERPPAGVCGTLMTTPLGLAFPGPRMRRSHWVFEPKRRSEDRTWQRC